MSKQREDFEAWLKLDGYDHHSFEISAFNEENYHNDWVQFAWSSWQQAQKVDVPNPTNEVICAIENTVEDQLIASGITSDPFRLDGEKIFNAMIEAGEKK